MAGVPPATLKPTGSSVWNLLKEGTSAVSNYAGDAISGFVSTIGAGINDVPSGDLAQSKYDFSYKVFPNDLGMDYYGHYMVININVPTKTLSGEAAGQYTNEFTVIEPRQYSKVDTLRYKGGNSLTDGNRAAASLPRQTRRIVNSIALFMPQGLNFNSQNAYEDISLAEMGGKLLTGPVYGALETAGKLGRAPINPGVEVFYVSTYLRYFEFMFLCAPRNQAESDNLEQIIRTLRFHSSPEINVGASGLGAGITWIPPAEFDITFFNKGVENRRIPRINTCVMEGMQIDYNEGGDSFATFTNGHPVKVVITLKFREIEPVHKQRVLQGIY